MFCSTLSAGGGRHTHSVCGEVELYVYRPACSHLRVSVSHLSASYASPQQAGLPAHKRPCFVCHHLGAWNAVLWIRW